MSEKTEKTHAVTEMDLAVMIDCCMVLLGRLNKHINMDEAVKLVDEARQQIRKELKDEQ